MEKLMFANLKMNFNAKEITSYLETLLPLIKEAKCKVCLLVPYTYLMLANQKLTATNVKLGAQDISYHMSGNFTGEISAKMVKDFCKFVLVGHSERRNLCNETNEQINNKIKNALECGLKVVLCVGESKTDKIGKRTKQTLTKQVSEALRGLYENELNNVIIAYEPVWSVGTKNTLGIKEVEENIDIIRNIIKTDFSLEASKKIKIIYGGSIDTKNANLYKNIKNLNGLIVGQSALNPKDFASICLN